VLPNLIVPTLRRYDLLAELIESIDFPVQHLLVIDNGGELVGLPQSEWVEQVTILRMPANLGVAGSWNLGVKSFPFADRWFICSDDVRFSPGGLQSWFDQSSPEDVTVSVEWPHWQFFAVGERVIAQVGLFDECLFPANFEDDDFRSRCEARGVTIRQIAVDHFHVRQGTVFFQHYAGENARTYPLNEAYYRAKCDRGDLTAGEWSLERRRVQEWRK